MVNLESATYRHAVLTTATLTTSAAVLVAIYWIVEEAVSYCVLQRVARQEDVNSAR